MEKLSQRFLYYAGLLAPHVLNDKVQVDDLEHISHLLDAEEQGLLVKFPCDCKGTIYIINHNHTWIDVGNICGLSECDDLSCICYKVYIDPDYYTIVELSEFNKTWFFTEEEAEKALAEMQ